MSPYRNLMDPPDEFLRAAAVSPEEADARLREAESFLRNWEKTAEISASLRREFETQHGFHRQQALPGWEAALLQEPPVYQHYQRAFLAGFLPEFWEPLDFQSLTCQDAHACGLLATTEGWEPHERLVDVLSRELARVPAQSRGMVAWSFPIHDVAPIAAPDVTTMVDSARDGGANVLRGTVHGSATMLAHHLYRAIPGLDSYSLTPPGLVLYEDGWDELAVPAVWIIGEEMPPPARPTLRRTGASRRVRGGGWLRVRQGRGVPRQRGRASVR